MNPKAKLTGVVERRIGGLEIDGYVELEHVIVERRIGGLERATQPHN